MNQKPHKICGFSAEIRGFLQILTLNLPKIHKKLWFLWFPWSKSMDFTDFAIMRFPSSKVFRLKNEIPIIPSYVSQIVQNQWHLNTSTIFVKVQCNEVFKSRVILENAHTYQVKRKSQRAQD